MQTLRYVRNADVKVCAECRHWGWGVGVVGADIRYVSKSDIRV